MLEIGDIVYCNGGFTFDPCIGVVVDKCLTNGHSYYYDVKVVYSKATDDPAEYNQHIWCYRSCELTRMIKENE